MASPVRRVRAQLREFALGLPEAHEDLPWGERVVKVKKKVFVFLGRDMDAHFGLGVKLGVSHESALALPFTAWRQRPYIEKRLDAGLLQALRDPLDHGFVAAVIRQKDVELPLRPPSRSVGLRHSRSGAADGIHVVPGPVPTFLSGSAK